MHLYIFYFTSFSGKYPQIKKLFGVDPTFKWKVVTLVLVQFCMIYLMQGRTWPVIVLTAYLFGGVINHALMLGKPSVHTGGLSLGQHEPESTILYF